MIRFKILLNFDVKISDYDSITSFLVDELLMSTVNIAPLEIILLHPYKYL